MLKLFNTLIILITGVLLIAAFGFVVKEVKQLPHQTYVSYNFSASTPLQAIKNIIGDENIVDCGEIYKPYYTVVVSNYKPKLLGKLCK